MGYKLFKRRVLRREFRSSAVSNATLYAAAHYGQFLLVLIANFVARTLVSPLAFGAMAYVRSINIYPRQINSILPSAIGRQLPQLYARGRNSEAERFVNTSHATFMFLLVIQFAIYTVIAALQNSFYLRFGFLTIAVFNLFSQMANLYRWVLFADNQFRAIAFLMLASGLLHLGLVVTLSIGWRDPGYFGALMGSSLINFTIAFLLLAHLGRTAFKLQWDRSAARSVFLAGSPMVLMGVALGGMQTADKLFVRHYLGLKTLGYYSLACAGLMVLNLLPQSVVGSYLPRHLSHVTAGRCQQLAHRRLELQSVVGRILCLLIGLAFVAVSPLINAMLPDYRRIIHPFRILLLSSFFYGSSILPYHIHLAENKMKRANLIALFSLAAAIAIYAQCAPYGLGVLAWGVTGVMALYSTGLIASAHHLKVAGLWQKMLLPLLTLVSFYCFYYFVSRLFAYGLYSVYAVWQGRRLWLYYRAVFGVSSEIRRE